MRRAFLLLALATVPTGAQGPQGTLATYLERRIGLDAGQRAALENGQAVVKLLDQSSQRNFAVFGIIKVDVPREFYIARVQDFQSSLRAPTRHGFGIFHTPARADDVAELFWADDRAPRLRPTLSVMHLVVFAPPELATTTMVAAKQIYVNHYLEAAFDVTAVVDRQNAAGQPGVYLIVLHRFRLDAQPDANIRRILVKELRDQVQSELARQREASERAYATRAH